MFTTSRILQSHSWLTSVSATLFIVALLPFNVLAADGKILFILGDAHILSQSGEERNISRGVEIFAGDTIVTSTHGQVQLRMSDGGLIAVRPNSEFHVESYQYKDEASDNSIFKLLKGGFRSITGAVGQADKKAYKVKTPVATIGIRGTDYTARLCEADCIDVTDGLYIGVMSGGVILKNDAGSIDIDPGDHGFVADSFTQPEFSNDIPSELLFAQNSTDSQPLDNLVITEASNTDENVLAQTGSNADGNVIDFSEQTITGVDNNSATPMSNWVMVQHDPSFLIGNMVSLSATDTNPNTDAATGISWGIWSSGALVFENRFGGTSFLFTASNTHWIGGTLEDTAALSTTGTMDYTMIAGGSQVTSFHADSGFLIPQSSTTIDSATLSVNFDQGTATSHMMMTDNYIGSSWEVSSSSMAISDGRFSGTLTADDGFLGTGNGAVAGGLSGAVTNGIPAGAYYGFELSTINGGFPLDTDYVGTVALE